MDIVFKCKHCNQQLAVDDSGAGSEIECPSCGGRLVIPASVPPAHEPGHAVNPIMSSAAAKLDVHYKVPVHEGPAESLIKKALPTLETAVKESTKIRVKTIRHTDCIEVGHDRFDDHVTSFLNKVGHENIVSITPLAYTHYDIGSQKLLTEYGVLIVYKG